MGSRTQNLQGGLFRERGDGQEGLEDLLVAPGCPRLEFILARLYQNGSALSRSPRGVSLQHNGIAVLQPVLTDKVVEVAILDLDTRGPKS